MLPLLDDLLPETSGWLLDLGCGEGQGMRHTISRGHGAARLMGCDLNRVLLQRAATAGPCVLCELPDLGWLRAEVLSGAYAVLVLEHLEDLEPLFLETARVVQRGGFLVVVMNHPAYTPPGAGPIIDQSDGEVLWRWGRYFEVAAGDEPAGSDMVRFYHRPLGDVLSTAASCGWSLVELEERPLSPAAVARDPGLAGQEHLPRLMGARWRRA